MTPNEYTSNLLQDIRQYMKHHRITQSELSERTGISTTTLSRWFNGAQLPNLYSFCQMMDGLSVDIKLKERRQK